MPVAWVKQLAKIRVWATVLVTAYPQIAPASCELAGDLATLHSAYSDLIEGRGTPREDIGRFVIQRQLNGSNNNDFGDTLKSSGFYGVIDQLRPVLDDMSRLAELGAEVDDINHHRANIEGLAGTLRTTGCFEATAELTASAPDTSVPSQQNETQNGQDGASETSNVTGQGPAARLSKLITDKAPISFFVIGILTALLVALCLIGRSVYRNVRARAFPRFPFGGQLPITDSTGKKVDRIVADISRGGIMMQRPVTIDTRPFKRASITLPDGEFSMKLVWDNIHFFGYQFEKPIDQHVLDSVMALDIDSQLSKLTLPTPETTNSAPEGAAETAA